MNIHECAYGVAADPQVTCSQPGVRRLRLCDEQSHHHGGCCCLARITDVPLRLASRSPSRWRQHDQIRNVCRANYVAEIVLCLRVHCHGVLDIQDCVDAAVDDAVDDELDDELDVGSRQAGKLSERGAKMAACSNSLSLRRNHMAETDKQGFIHAKPKMQAATTVDRAVNLIATER